MFTLQSRWRLGGRNLVNYGLRNRGKLFHNTIHLTAKQTEIIQRLPDELCDRKKRTLGKLLMKQVVPEEELRKIPGLI